MKSKYKLLYCLLFLLVAITGCKKNVSDPEFGTGDMPRIFQMTISRNARDNCSCLIQSTTTTLQWRLSRLLEIPHYLYRQAKVLDVNPFWTAV